MKPDFFGETAFIWKNYWGFFALFFVMGLGGFAETTNPFIYSLIFNFLLLLVVGFIRFLFRNTAYNYRERKYEKQQEKEWKKRTEAEEKQHQIAVRRERDILEARADVQINTMQRLHAQNVNVERQLMELRKELQSIENEENRAFMEDMIRQAENSLRR